MGCRGMRQRLSDGGGSLTVYETYVISTSPSVAVLWAIAVEIDDRQATRTGFRVCRACGGRGEVWAWGRRPILASSTPTSTRPIPTDQDVRDGAAQRRDMDVETARRERHGDAQRWAWREPCPCDGPTRPDTTPLARMVRLLATLGQLLSVESVEDYGEW